MMCLVSSSLKLLRFCRRCFRSPPSQSSVTRYILWRPTHTNHMTHTWNTFLRPPPPLVHVIILTFGVSKTSCRCIICSCFTCFNMLTSLSRCLTPEVPACRGTKHCIRPLNSSLVTTRMALHPSRMSTGETWWPYTYLLFVHLLNCPLPPRLNVSDFADKAKVALT